jgi:hypothetical protein
MKGSEPSKKGILGAKSSKPGNSRGADASGRVEVYDAIKQNPALFEKTRFAGKL